MPKFTLIAEHTDLQQKPDGSKMNYEFHCEYLPEILNHFELFLRGCGFNPNGTLDFVSDEEYYGWEPEEDWTGDGLDGMGSTMADYPELYDEQDLSQEKSHYYFDTQRNK